MANFKAPKIDKQRPTKYAKLSNATLIDIPMETADFYYFYAEDKAQVPAAINHCMNQMARTNSREQYLACFFGIFKMTTRGLEDHIKEWLECIGINPERMALPINEEDKFGTPAPMTYKVLPYNIILCWLVCHILIVFKVIPKEYYSLFMKDRLRAIRAKLGISEVDVADDFIPFEKAKWVRETFGSFDRFKRELIYYIIERRAHGGIDAGAFDYLHDILSYNGMFDFIYVYETFLITTSPALQVPEVYHELNNLKRAFEAINASKYPYFYRDLCSADEEKVLLRKNFPTIVAAARRIRMETIDQYQMKYFASASDPVRNPAVEKLCKIHARFMRQQTRVGQINDFANLTNRKSADEAAIESVLGRETLCWSDDEDDLNDTEMSKK